MHVRILVRYVISGTQIHYNSPKNLTGSFKLLLRITEMPSLGNLNMSSIGALHMSTIGTMH